MKYSNLDEKELLVLQKKYRKGIVKEEDMTEDEIKDLELLYQKQIKYVKELIEQDKKKIIELRKKYNM